MGSGRKPDALHAELIGFLSTLKHPHHRRAKDGRESDGSAQIYHKLLSDVHSNIFKIQNSMTSRRTFLSTSKHLSGDDFFSSGSGMFSTDARFRSDDYNARSSGIEPSQDTLSEMTSNVKVFKNEAASEVTLKSNTLKKRQVEPLPESSIESLDAKMNRLAAELHQTQTEIRLYRNKQSKPSKQTNDPHYDEINIQANDGPSDAYLAAEEEDHPPNSRARPTAKSKQLMLSFTSTRPPPPADIAVHTRREPLRTKPVFFAPSNSTTTRHPRYWLNRPDPKRELMEGRGVVVSAWPGVESHPPRHMWGYDGRDRYNRTAAAARPVFNYSRAQHPYLAYNNHAMRSQPEFFDPEGPANRRLVTGALPAVFGDSWRRPSRGPQLVSCVRAPRAVCGRDSTCRDC